MPIGKVAAPAVLEAVTPNQPLASDQVYADPNVAKSRRILVQGIVQAVVQSPIIAGLGYATEAEAVALIKRVSTELINFVDNN